MEKSKDQNNLPDWDFKPPTPPPQLEQSKVVQPIQSPKPVQKLTEQQVDDLLFKEKSSTLDDFEIIRNFGEGNFSIVKIVENTKYNIKYALKVIDRFRLSQKKKEMDVLMQKHCLLKLYKQPGIIKLITTFKDDMNLYLLLEFCYGGQLWELSRGYGLIFDGLCRYYFKKICEAVSNIHKHKIAHRDLKSENILIKKDMREVRIIDFGSARDMQSDQIRSKMSQREKKFQHYVGTPQYMAPECIRNRNSSPSSDIWSLGCVLYQMYAGVTPFKKDTDYLTFKSAIDDELNLLSDVIIPQTAQDLIKLMIVKDEDKRITIEDVLKHPLLSQVADAVMISPLPSSTQISLRVLTNDLLKRQNVYKFEGKDSVINVFEELKKDLEQSEFEKVDYFKEIAIKKIFQ